MIMHSNGIVPGKNVFPEFNGVERFGAGLRKHVGPATRCLCVPLPFSWHISHFPSFFMHARAQHTTVMATTATAALVRARKSQLL